MLINTIEYQRKLNTDEQTTCEFRPAMILLKGKLYDPDGIQHVKSFVRMKRMYENLFQKVKAGDKKSFELLFKAFYAPLCLYSGKFVPDRDECEEIVQSFFTKLWEKREKLEINTSVKNYLFGSVRNMCFNHLKHMKIRKEYSLHVSRDENRGNDYSDVFIEVDLIERIEKAIADLPNRRREIFLLNREQGLKYREIAERLNISVKTVETQMGQALKTLRDKLREYKTILIGLIVFTRC